MATQFGDIATWAAETVMKRADLLAAAVDEAISVYRLTCGKVPFDILQTTSAEFPTSIGVASYSISNFSPSVAGICSVRMTFNSATKRRLRRSHVRVYDGLGNISNGKPSSYARWGGNIEFNVPCDSSSYTYRMRYWSMPNLPISTANVEEKANTELVTPEEWDELFKWETLYRLYYINNEPEKAMSLTMGRMLPIERGAPRRIRMKEQGIIPRLWNDLLLTVHDREGVDEDFSINPVVREYTA